MSTLVATKKLGDVVKWEQDARYCRAVKTLLSGQSVKLGQICRSDTAGKKVAISGTGNEVHRYNPNAAPTAGYFKFRLWHKDGYWVETAWLAYDASQSDIDTAVEAVLGSSAVTTSGTAATQIDFTFGGTGYANLYQPLGYMDISRLTGVSSVAVTRTTAAAAYGNEVQTVAMAGSLGGTGFRLGIPTTTGGYVWTAIIAYNANAATIQTAIETALGLGANAACVCSGTNIGSMVFTFSGATYAGKAWPAIQVDPATTTGFTGITVTRNAAPDSIAMADIDASTGDTTGLFLVRGPAVVDADRLVFGAGNIDYVKEALREVGIEARSEATQRELQVN